MMAGPDAIVVLVGITAGWGKRRFLRRWLTARASLPVFVPWLPYGFGLHAAGQRLRACLDKIVLDHGRIHVLAYIGGSVLLRRLIADGAHLPLGRVLYVRGPIQELVASLMMDRVPCLLLTAAGQRSMIDLARTDWQNLPFPDTAQESGLIIEANPSRRARKLGLSIASVGSCGWDPAALAPGAAFNLTLPLSHDDVYTAPALLCPAMEFLQQGTIPKGAKLA